MGLVFPVLIVAVGVGWLLSSLGLLPGVDWVWSGALLVAGVLTFVFSGGVDKVSLVYGALLLLAGVLSVLRQTGVMTLDVTLPVLVIALGLLKLAARSPAIPEPAWAGRRTGGGPPADA